MKWAGWLLWVLCATACAPEPRCGNGIVERGESCDDGNASDVDYCLSTCVLARCGDGLKAPFEACDAGGANGANVYGGCTLDCTLGAHCGDGVVQHAHEECDLGRRNADSGACLSTCLVARCGDGLVHASVEVCDDHFTDACGSCNESCSGPGVAAVCGDGAVCSEVEECDDQNDDSRDACLGSCQAARCGDGFVGPFEVCDDACFGFVALDAKADLACGVRRNGRLQCFGPAWSPALDLAPQHFVQAASGGDYVCAIDRRGHLVCLGTPQRADLLRPPLGTFTQVSCAPSRACALSADGRVVCWGEALSSKPPPGPFLQISLGKTHACGLRPNYALDCFGDDSFGQASPPRGTFWQVSAGEDATCAIDAQRAIVCFGKREPFEANSPRAGSFSEIALGPSLACARRQDGALWCFGNAWKQEPLAARGLSNIAVGGAFVCGIDAQGLPQCIGATPDAAPTPVPRPACDRGCSSIIEPPEAQIKDYLDCDVGLW